MKARKAAPLVAVIAWLAISIYWSAFRSVDLPPANPAVEPSRDPTAFVGSEACAPCHAAQFAAWQQSTHGRAGGEPTPDRVIAPFSGAPIRFTNADVVPRVRSGVYEFVVRRASERPETLSVDGVVGGGHIYGGGTQGFLTRRGDGTLRLIPFEWSRHNRAWFCNTNSRSGRGWAPITPGMRIEECGDWPPTRVIGDVARFANCQSCHASQATTMLDSTAGKYVTRLASLSINCESCHGPGRVHIANARAGRSHTDSLSGAIALATLDKEASVTACYQCHSVKDQLREGYVSGDPLEGYYSLKFPLLGDSPLFADGRVRTFAYQEGHSFSECFLNGGMTCVSCHDPHDQSYRTFTTRARLTGRFDDAQCTSCHVSKAAQPANHSRHPQAVRCVACHMPGRQQPETRALNPRFRGTPVVRYERADHTISIPRPLRDDSLGLVAACASCHAELTAAQHAERARALWGAIKPPAPPTHPYAVFMSAARLLETVTPDLELGAAERRRLDTLLASSDLDTRSLALAALHLSEGTSRPARRRLADALRSDSSGAELRARWAIALGYMGDQYAANRRYGNAVTALSRAVDVLPSRARLHLNLANARRDNGDLAGALESYRRSIALDGRAPLAWVNYGIALATASDTAGALQAFGNASALDAREPLAWFNAANIHYVRRDLDRAADLYERAVASDPSLVQGHFQLARIRLTRNDAPGALAALRRGLAFDSSNTAARDLAKSLDSGRATRP